jgi:hypothetical protein
MKWLSQFFAALGRLLESEPRVMFPERAAAEAKVRREARHAEGELVETIQMGSNSIGTIISFTIPIETDGFTDDELNRICRSEISQRYRVWVCQGNLEVEYYISGPDL